MHPDSTMAYVTRLPRANLNSAFDGVTLKEPAISLVVPTFNSAGSIARSLESVERQNFADVEVVIVDGASRDDTLVIARAFHRIAKQIHSAPDAGVYDAINKGLAMARGSLIGVLGSDDELAAGALDCIWQSWKRNPTDIVAGLAMLENEAGISAIRRDEHYGPGARLTGIPFCHNAMYVARAAYQRVGPYDLKYRIVADADWVHRAIALGCSAQKIDKVVVNFRHGGISTTNAEEILAESFALVTANFPGLDLNDAETLFRAVRGWSDVARVDDVLSRHQGNGPLLLAVASAFAHRAQGLAQALADSPMPVTAGRPSHRLRGLARRLRSALRRAST